ncbi:hypothetical protein LV82_00347 [Albidovulum inexpectatum]|uniref:Uncharacterized protein n=2 Tax=Albidovulum inexpectatum TaxID=196587 RepID=A0A2S5JLI7_9RHOB|nr:hypothetical protein LV82_00347 [Albidovulum inexpectatum]
MRAMLIVVLIATPSLMIPGTTSDTTQMVALIAIFAGALTFFEYVSSYPGLIEFRDAPPFNRIRYLSLLITILVLSAMVRGQTHPSTLTNFLIVLGDRVGQMIDVPYSPVRLVVLMLPEDMSLKHLILVRSAAGMAYVISLSTVIFFTVTMRIMGWPQRIGTFNVWVNLPTFDPTTGGDVVERLSRDARVNIALGFLLPFLVPAAVKMASMAFSPVTLENPHTLVWTMAAWAFLPASLFMRGVALARVARMIEQKRRGSARKREHGLAAA